MRGVELFDTDEYRQHNAARMAHFKSLGFDLRGKRVLEVGAGVGDHTRFLVDQGADVHAIEGRQGNLDVLRERLPGVRASLVNLEYDDCWDDVDERYDFVYFYGTLYHTWTPAHILWKLSKRASTTVVETQLLPDNPITSIREHNEPADDPTQALNGRGCRMTRQWLWNCMVQNWRYVFQTRSQPDHPEFPTDWARVHPELIFVRGVFVGSNENLDMPTLFNGLPERQERLRA